jgi:hypothetical protein
MRARAADMGNTLLTYAKEDCHDFAVAFHAAMPREIRDQVYTLLFDSMSDRLKTQSRITSSDPYSRLGAHWLFSDFVGLDFARECVEICYEQTNFVFANDANWDLREQLGTDIFGYGVVPSHHIRSCQFNLVDDEEKEPDISGRHLDTDEYTLMIDAFLELKQRSAQVHYKIETFDPCEVRRLAWLISNVRLLAPLLHRHKEEGAIFEVFVAPENMELKEKWREITFLWDISPQALMEKLREWSKAIGMIQKVEHQGSPEY